MHPEEELDQLLDEQLLRGSQFAPSSEAVAASLAAAKMLVQLQELAPPARFEHRLEGKIRASARAQRDSRLIETGKLIPLPSAPGALSPLPRPRKRRTWVATLGAVAVLLIAFASLLTFSAHNELPNLPFGWKQAQNQETLTARAEAQNAANAALGHLRNALADLTTVVNEGRDDRAIRQALKSVSLWTSMSREAVAALSPGSARQATQHNLNEVLAEEDQTLRLLLGRVGFSIKVAFTRQLGMLGDPVPRVIYVTVRAQTNGTLLISLTGKNFASRAQLMIEGKLTGTVIQRSASLLVAVVSGAQRFPEMDTIGVLNPDGTAAQMDDRA